jgi:hypothetical protein
MKSKQLIDLAAAIADGGVINSDQAAEIGYMQFNEILEALAGDLDAARNVFWATTQEILTGKEIGPDLEDLVRISDCGDGSDTPEEAADDFLDRLVDKVADSYQNDAKAAYIAGKCWMTEIQNEGCDEVPDFFATEDEAADNAAVKSAAGCEVEGFEEDGFDYKVSRLTIAYDQIYVLPD